MSQAKCILFFLICVSNFLSAQALMPQVCTLRTSSGISIQQVDNNWKKVPFDCENIEVHIQSETDTIILKPGDLHDCKYRFSSNPNHAISIVGEQPGVYSVMIKRFDEVNNFKDVKVEWNHTGCDVMGQVLEVQFDMTKK